MLCTSGFMDDVTFGRNGRDAGRGWHHSASSIDSLRARPRRSLMSMNACFLYGSHLLRVSLVCVPLVCS